MEAWTRTAKRAAERDGHVTGDEARTEGLSASAQSRLVAGGRLIRPQPKVLRVAGAPATPRALVTEALDSIGGAAGVTGWTGLWALGLRRSLPSTIEVAVPRGQSPRPRSDVAVHRLRWLAESDFQGGDIRITRMAVILLVLARSASEDFLRSLLIHARQLRLVTLDEVRDVCRRARNAPGTALLRRLCADLDETDVDSLLELRFRQRWARTSWPQPLPGRLEIPTPRHPIEVDVPWPRYQTGVDCHGMGKYDTAWDLDRDTRRDNHGKATDWVILEATWGRVTGSEWPDLVDEITDVLDLQASRLGLPPIRRST